jgi:hypothetical protein
MSSPTRSSLITVRMTVENDSKPRLLASTTNLCQTGLPHAARLQDQHILARVLRSVGVDQPGLRATLVATQLSDPSAVAPTIQHYITGDILSSTSRCPVRQPRPLVGRSGCSQSEQIGRVPS